MHLLKDIFTYAYRGSGKYILLLGAGLHIAYFLVQYAPLIGIVATLCMLSYLLATYFQIIVSTATGEKEAPEFPGLSDLFEDIIAPFFRMIGIGLICFSPAIAYAAMVGFMGAHSIVIMLLLLLGLAYFPMAVLAVAMLGHISAALPHIIFPSLYRAGWIYWLGILLIAILYIAERILSLLFPGDVFYGILLFSLTGMYIMMTNGRILGLVYREREEELGWL